MVTPHHLYNSLLCKSEEEKRKKSGAVQCRNQFIVRIIKRNIDGIWVNSRRLGIITSLASPPSCSWLIDVFISSGYQVYVYIVYIQHAHTTERVWVRTGLSLLLVCQPINRLEKTVVSLAPPPPFPDCWAWRVLESSLLSNPARI